MFGTVSRHGLVAAMNPYLKPWAYRVRRIVNGWESGECWYPEKARIDVGAAPVLVAEGGQKPFNPYDPTIYPPPAVSDPAPSDPTASRILCANAAHVVYEIMTDTEDGMGYPAGSLDDASFETPPTCSTLNALACSCGGCNPTRSSRHCRTCWIT